jgi:isoleucyl-tRNA synthetase
MSKSVGNVVEPQEAIDRHGRDPMRLFLLSVTAQEEDMKFSWDEMAEMGRRLNILWNVFRFPLPYMRMDGFDPDAVDLADADLELVDEWVLSRLATVEREMTDHLDAFEGEKALDTLLAFVVEDVSRFYVQEVRERMWEEVDSASKEAAYATLYRVLRETVALLAPYAPFVAEEMYGTLTGEAEHPTVHMCDWPTGEAGWRDETLEADIAAVRAVEEAGSNARQQAERSLRWPVREVVVEPSDAAVAEPLERRQELVAERLNARAVTVLDADEDWERLAFGAEADMSLLGPAFGEDAGRVMEALNDARLDEPSLAALEAAVEDETGVAVDLDEEMVEFVRHTPEDVAGAAFAVADGEGVVYVDAGLTEDIESEGYTREVVRRVQEMRKDLDLEIDAEIRLDLSIADDRVADLVARQADYLEREVRAAERGAVEEGHRRTWEVDGIEVEIGIARVAEAAAGDD